MEAATEAAPTTMEAAWSTTTIEGCILNLHEFAEYVVSGLIRAYTGVRGVLEGVPTVLCRAACMFVKKTIGLCPVGLKKIVEGMLRHPKVVIACLIAIGVCITLNFSPVVVEMLKEFYAAKAIDLLKGVANILIKSIDISKMLTSYNAAWVAVKVTLAAVKFAWETAKTVRFFIGAAGYATVKTSVGLAARAVFEPVIYVLKNNSVEAVQANYEAVVVVTPMSCYSELSNEMPIGKHKTIVAAGMSSSVVGSTTGGVVGTFLCPGFGTIVGSVIGGYLVGYFGSKAGATLYDKFIEVINRKQ